MEQNIIEGNKLIAEFDGWIINGSNVQATAKDQNPFLVEELKYHTSWDWVMPVVEKIESMKTNEGNFEIFIFKRCCDIQTQKGTDHIIEITAAPSKIEAVWFGVVEFIKWYNGNTK